MKIILKYMAMDMKEHKIRTVVMLLSILLSTTLLFVSFSINASYESAQQKMARGMAGSATVSIGAGEGTSNIVINRIPDLPSMQAKVGVLKGTALYHEKGYYETIDLIAADLMQFNQINKLRLLDDDDIADFSGKQIILPDRFTSKYGIKKGDALTLQVSGTPVTFTVKAIAAYDTVFLRHTRGATALLPLTTLAGLLEQADGYSEVLVEPAQGVSTSELIHQLRAALPGTGYQVSEIVNKDQITAEAREKSMPFYLISFFAFIMSIFIIDSNYKVITLKRLPMIGTFRSIGATQKAVTHILLGESILYGSIGGLLGIPVGMLVLKVILQGMGQSLTPGIAIPVVISLPILLLSFFAAIVVSLFSAWLPIRRASRLPLKDIVLGTVEEKRMPQRFVVGIGLVLLVVSVFLPHIASGTMLYLAGGSSLLGLIVSTILLIPFITNLISRGLEILYSLIFKNEGKLAARNIRDNKNMAQNITLLFISISAVIAIQVVGNFVTTYVSDVFHGAELHGFADGPMEQGFVEQVKNMDSIDKVLPLYVFKHELQGNGISFSCLEATDNLEWYNAMLALHYPEKEMEKQAVSAFATERSMVLSENCMERTGFSVGDTLCLTKGTKQNKYVIVGSFKSRATDVEAVIPSAYAVSDFGVTRYNFLAYTAADPDAIMVRIRGLFGSTANWSRTVEEFNMDALSTVGAFLKPMHSMTYFIVLVATMGVINNLLIYYMQKRRTIAMYKSVGLSNRQNMKITLLEGFSSGLIGAVIAMFVSYLEIQTIFIVAGPKIAMTPELDFATFLTAGAMGILITLIGSTVLILKNCQLKLVEEIKFV